MNLTRKLVVSPGSKFKLASRDPDAAPGIRNKAEAAGLLEKNLARIDELQFNLFAENRRSLLIVLQAMDAGGKDGTIRSLASGFNPQGCHVTSFKVPSIEEADHDFLWRIWREVPGKGEVGIFNRSHYEDVLVVRVHNLVPEEVWSGRYEQINTFEQYLVDSGTTVLKFFLHISKDEQKERFIERIEDPRKGWKFSPRDLEERALWDDYQTAYEQALRRCSTEAAPWFVIPANRNWYRNAAVSQIVVEAMERMNPRVPKTVIDRKQFKID